jgi:cytoplasmic iron level regulating protein YaaA (DUF328/UPF0246 family)
MFTGNIYRGLRVRGLPGDIQERARRKLRMIWKLPKGLSVLKLSVR